MTPTAFEDFLDRHGGDLTRWPHDLRGPASDLLAISPEARAALRGMADVEAVLASTRERGHHPGADRSAEVAARHRQVRAIAPTTRRAGWAAAAAAMLVLGLAIGDIKPTRDDGADLLVASSLETAGTGDVE